MEHAVIIYLPASKKKLQSAKFAQAAELLYERIESAIEEGEVGELDGDEQDLENEAYILYAYGPDADQLFEVIEPILSEEALARGGFAIKRYGSADDKDCKEVRCNF